MPDGLTVVLLIIAVVVAYVAATVVHYARKSERQWQDVDKSKLKTWDDDEWDQG